MATTQVRAKRWKRGRWVSAFKECGAPATAKENAHHWFDASNRKWAVARLKEPEFRVVGQAAAAAPPAAPPATEVQQPRERLAQMESANRRLEAENVRVHAEIAKLRKRPRSPDEAAVAPKRPRASPPVSRAKRPREEEDEVEPARHPAIDNTFGVEIQVGGEEDHRDYAVQYTECGKKGGMFVQKTIYKPDALTRDEGANKKLFDEQATEMVSFTTTALGKYLKENTTRDHLDLFPNVLFDAVKGDGAGGEVLVNPFNDYRGCAVMKDNEEHRFVTIGSDPSDLTLETYGERLLRQIQALSQTDDFDRELDGSDWVAVGIREISITVSRQRPMLGASYLQLPDWILHKKAVKNPQNSDDLCFLWALTLSQNLKKGNKLPERLRPSDLRHLAAAHGQPKNPETNEAWIIPEGMNFPLQIVGIGAEFDAMMAEFEQANSVHIFLYEATSTEHSVNPLYASKTWEYKKPCLQVLFWQVGEHGHFGCITRMERLMYNQIALGRTIAHVCPTCGTVFDTRQKHKISKHYVNGKCVGAGEMTHTLPAPGHFDLTKSELKAFMAWVVQAHHDTESITQGQQSLTTNSVTVTINPAFTETLEKHAPNIMKAMRGELSYSVDGCEIQNFEGGAFLMDSPNEADIVRATGYLMYMLSHEFHAMIQSVCYDLCPSKSQQDDAEATLKAINQQPGFDFIWTGDRLVAQQRPAQPGTPSPPRCGITRRTDWVALKHLIPLVKMRKQLALKLQAQIKDEAVNSAENAVQITNALNAYAPRCDDEEVLQEIHRLNEMGRVHAELVRRTPHHHHEHLLPADNSRGFVMQYANLGAIRDGILSCKAYNSAHDNSFYIRNADALIQGQMKAAEAIHQHLPAKTRLKALKAAEKKCQLSNVLAKSGEKIWSFQSGYTLFGDVAAYYPPGALDKLIRQAAKCSPEEKKKKFHRTLQRAKAYGFKKHNLHLDDEALLPLIGAKLVFPHKAHSSYDALDVPVTEAAWGAGHYDSDLSGTQMLRANFEKMQEVMQILGCNTLRQLMNWYCLFDTSQMEETSMDDQNIMYDFLGLTRSAVQTIGTASMIGQKLSLNESGHQVQLMDHSNHSMYTFQQMQDTLVGGCSGSFWRKTCSSNHSGLNAVRLAPVRIELAKLPKRAADLLPGLLEQKTAAYEMSQVLKVLPRQLAESVKITKQLIGSRCYDIMTTKASSTELLVTITEAEAMQLEAPIGEAIALTDEPRSNLTAEQYQHPNCVHETANLRDYIEAYTGRRPLCSHVIIKPSSTIEFCAAETHADLKVLQEHGLLREHPGSRTEWANLTEVQKWFARRDQSMLKPEAASALFQYSNLPAAAVSATCYFNPGDCIRFIECSDVNSLYGTTQETPCITGNIKHHFSEAALTKRLGQLSAFKIVHDDRLKAIGDLTAEELKRADAPEANEYIRLCATEPDVAVGYFEDGHKQHYEQHMKAYYTRQYNKGRPVQVLDSSGTNLKTLARLEYNAFTEAGGELGKPLTAEQRTVLKLDNAAQVVRQGAIKVEAWPSAGMVLVVDIDPPSKAQIWASNDFPETRRVREIDERELSRYTRDKMQQLGQKMDKTMRLVPDFTPKRHYKLTRPQLGRLLTKGYKLKAVHEIISYNQAPVLAPYIEKCTARRAVYEAEDNASGSAQMKLLPNSCYGKMQEKVERHTDQELVHPDSRRALKLQRDPRRKQPSVISENLVLWQRSKTSVLHNRPLQVSISVLSDAKLIMEEAADVLKEACTAAGAIGRVVAHDTDCHKFLVCSNDTGFNYYKDVVHKIQQRAPTSDGTLSGVRNQPLFDMAKWPRDHFLYTPAYRKLTGYLDCESNGVPVLALTTVRSKVYAKAPLLGVADMKLKGVPGRALRKSNYLDYFSCVMGETKAVQSQSLCYGFMQSKRLKRETVELTKRALVNCDLKRFVCGSGIGTLAYGTPPAAVPPYPAPAL